MERTRTRPDNFSLSPFKTSATLAGLMGSGSITSVSSTPLGTVSSMRANMVAQVEANKSGDLANLRSQSESGGGPEEHSAYESMVALLSLAKMRLSELVVSLAPTTSGFCVVPAMYSVALQNTQCPK